MSIGWVAGSVRAEALVNRRLGTSMARELAGLPSLVEALDVLADSSYGHDVRPEHTLVQAERAIGATLLWHMRVLAGWQPRPRGEMVRILAGGFEISNVDDLLATTGAAPYRLGTLATAWPFLAKATSLTQIRDVLAASAWGDPGMATPVAIGLAMRLAWADRVIAGVPDARRWAAGAAALLVAKEKFVHEHVLDSRRAAALLGQEAVFADSLDDYRTALPDEGRWALADIAEPRQLWRGEAAWWTTVEQRGFDLMQRARFDSRALVGALAVLAVDAWRVRAALQMAARGGGPLEVFDAIT
ncbi:hypothetical protein DMH04_17765 [Kibdelosporangium aridum]|uniref:V-type ATPase subunit n=1 Tax=Kibdelosporangium aridum TaxID=2030 RepID=A0A428ZAZ3_KIBAR|nr:hypothetical protein [Kibdelosporangium aridum]RSM85150.1 hypothetical protein DMH04_17765 [Kibdelosporangium aridum]